MVTDFNVLPQNVSRSAENGISITTQSRTGAVDNSVPDNSMQTGISFPGRLHYRPLISFDEKEEKHCGKRYAASSKFSPGVLVVTCTCSNPKLIGFITMLRCESTSLALSSVLMFFQVPPLIMLYDNGCNTLSSALLRIP